MSHPQAYVYGMVQPTVVVSMPLLGSRTPTSHPPDYEFRLLQPEDVTHTDLRGMELNTKIAPDQYTGLPGRS
jgi:hypothetical protein